MEKARRPRDLEKITAHKRYPSNQIKSIIKKNDNFTSKSLLF